MGQYIDFYTIFMPTFYMISIFKKRIKNRPGGNIIIFIWQDIGISGQRNLFCVRTIRALLLSPPFKPIPHAPPCIASPSFSITFDHSKKPSRLAPFCRMPWPRFFVWPNAPRHHYRRTMGKRQRMERWQPQTKPGLPAITERPQKGPYQVFMISYAYSKPQLLA